MLDCLVFVSNKYNIHSLVHGIRGVAVIQQLYCFVNLLYNVMCFIVLLTYCTV